MESSTPLPTSQPRWNLLATWILNEEGQADDQHRHRCLVRWLIKKDYKIVTMLTSGSTVTLTTVGDTRRAGTNYIPSRVLKTMHETNGQRVIKEQKENGNEL